MSQTRTYHKYTPDEMDEREFLARFVVRNELFERIISDIRTANYEVPQQHYIIVGLRGQGKTTLLRKIQVEIKNDPKLFPTLIPIKFSEEQYHIRSLARVWEEVADILQSDFPDIFPSILDKMEEHESDDGYDDFCFEFLETEIRRAGKKLVLLIDNIDLLLDKMTEKEQRRLREILTTSSSFRIIGGSTNMLEQHFNYGKPFFEFFKIVKLKGLTAEETRSFLQALANEDEKKKIETIINQSPERIEALRRLTGGVPRTMVMLFDVFMDDVGNAFEDLMKVLDEVTPLYKHRMDDLPTQLQDIVHTIAMNWDGIATKDIAQRTRIASKIVSAQLSQLEKSELIESESIGKNKIYKVKERFFNIWYLMRFGRKKDRQRVEWLVKFLESWCTPDDLNTKAKRLIDSLKTKSACDNYAYYMTEALSYAGLDMGVEHELKETAKEYLTEKKSKYCNEISASDLELVKQANELFKKDKLEEALNTLQKCKKENKESYALKATILYMKGNFNEAERYCLKAIENGDVNSLHNLAVLYSDQGKLVEAEKYYLKAIESGDIKSLNNLSILYYKKGNFIQAEALFLKAIEKGVVKATFNLGNLYREQGKYHEAEIFYLKSIKSGSKISFNNLAGVYYDQGKYKESEKYYLKAIENGNNRSLYNLGNLYCKKGNISQAEECYLKAGESGDGASLNNLAILYHKQGKYVEAEKNFLKAIDVGITESLNNIARLYVDQGKNSEAEKYFLKAIDNDDTNAQNNYAWFLFLNGKHPGDALKYAQGSYNKEKSCHPTHTYATILLWNDRFLESYDKFIEWLAFEKTIDSEQDVIRYFLLLFAKNQLYRAKKLFELPDYELKERYKPLWYALAKLLKDEMKDESAKMGSELEESVAEILQKVDHYKQKYSIPAAGTTSGSTIV